MDVSQCKIEFKFFNSSFLDLRTPYLQNDRNTETQKDSMTEWQKDRKTDKITNRWKDKKSEWQQEKFKIDWEEYDAGLPLVNICHQYLLSFE